MSKMDVVNDDLDEISEDMKKYSDSINGNSFLVVGGRGFLGTYFVKTILKLNERLKKSYKIIICDNLITAKDKGKFDDENVKFIEADISQEQKIDNNIDYIIHAASIASPPFYRKYPLKTVDVNYQGTRNLLNLAREKKVKSMLFLSSSEIYGDPEIIPTPESFWGHVSSTGPRACYDESKRLAETVSMIYHQQYNVPVKIARPFNVYGPYLNLNDGRVIPDFMKNTINGSPIIIHSDGSPTRSFCYISDAMKAFFRILFLAKPGSIFNVGQSEEISMKVLAQKISKLADKPIDIKIEKSQDPNYTKDNPQRRCPDLSRISQLGYEPKITIDEGIKRTYQWYMENK